MGNTAVAGKWIVTETEHEDYENSYSNPIAFFDTEEEADSMIATYEAKQQALIQEHAEKFPRLQTGRAFYWSKNFVPEVSATPELVYIFRVSTTRIAEENGKRALRDIRATLVNPATDHMSSLMQTVMANPDKAFVLTENEDELEDSAVFPPLVYMEEYNSFNGEHEWFYTLNVESVVLDPPAGYVHPTLPEPVNNGYGIEADLEGLAEWERELLGGIAEDSGKA
jgi:hypothetical protein